MRGSRAVRCVLPCTVTKKSVDILVKRCPKPPGWQRYKYVPFTCSPSSGASGRGLLFFPWPAEQLYLLVWPCLAVCVWRKTTFSLVYGKEKQKEWGERQWLWKGSVAFLARTAAERRETVSSTDSGGSAGEIWVPSYIFRSI